MRDSSLVHDGLEMRGEVTRGRDERGWHRARATDRIVTTETSPLSERPSATGSHRIVALDGLRAIALLGIMAFHFGVGALNGGFFGVDVFYVLSGYLITGLLLSEMRRTRRIGLVAFWIRRARRLLPALLVMLVVVMMLVRFDAAPGLYPSIRSGALSSLFYVSNWSQIAQSGSYFVATGPVSPLTHTWSLAVEEQFYLVWPLVVVAVMGLSAGFKRGVRALLALSIIGTVASSIEMAVLYRPTGNTTRLYFGTDTHAQSILVGAAVACVLTLVELRRGNEGMAPPVHGRRAQSTVTALGVAGLVGVIAMAVLLTGSSSFDYRGGFLLCSLLTAAALVAAVCVPRGILATVLSLRAFVWLGSISYGAYLWHFPIAVFVTSSNTGLGATGLLFLRLIMTIGIAAASFYLIERPILDGHFWRSIKAVPVASLSTAAVVGVIIVATIPAGGAPKPVTHFSASHAGSRPAHLVVLGDSTGLTLGYALKATAPVGTTVENAALFGCGTPIGAMYSNDPPNTGEPMFAPCNSATPALERWPARDASAIAATGPGDVVLYVGGTWECQDILRDGRWQNITQSGFRRYVLAQLEVLEATATAKGAHLEMTTMPAIAEGRIWGAPSVPDDSAQRRLLYDQLVRQVASQHPRAVSVIDYAHVLTPRGHFAETLDGVQVRTPDGVHTPAFAPGDSFASNSTPQVAQAFYDWISPRIWPMIIDHNVVAQH